MARCPVVLTVVFVGCWALAARSARAESRGVTVRPAGPELFEVEPRQIVTAAFRVTNTSDRARSFLAQVLLPPGWRLITEEFPFEVEAGRSEVRLVAFLAPRATLAGRYTVTYVVGDRTAPSRADRCTLTVVILPVEQLVARLVEAPQVAIAGEAYRASFLVVDQGNVPARVAVVVHSGGGLPAVVDPASFTLGPGQSKLVTVTVKTPPDQPQRLKHVLRFAADAPELRKGGHAAVVSCVEIVPRVSTGEDPYYRLPARLTFRSLYEDAGRRRRGGFQTEFAGGGPLDEEKSQHVAFLFRGPDLRDRSLYGLPDEYRVSYWNDRGEIHLGDRTYALTPLTELGLYGRGAAGSFKRDGLTVGGYLAESRWLEPNERQAAAFLRAPVGERHDLELSFLRRSLLEPRSARLPPAALEGDLVSLRSRSSPFKNLDLDLEYAAGHSDSPGRRGLDSALRAEALGRLGRATYQFKFIRAGPKFPGYYSDMQFVSAGFTSPLVGPLGLHADYRDQRDNLERDPDLSTAAEDRFRRAGLDLRLPTRTTLTVDWQQRARRGLLSPPKFDEEERTVALLLSQAFRRASFSLSAETGRIEDRLRGERGPLRQYRASVFCAPSRALSWSAYVTLRDDGGLGFDKHRNLTGGLAASCQLDPRTRLALNACRSDYQHHPYTGSRDLLELRLTRTLPNKATLAVTARHTAWRGSSLGNETAVLLEYSIPLAIPLGRKKSVGGVKGRVFDRETGRGFPQAILRLNGATAVTDANGRYAFPAVRPGTYSLALDPRRLATDKVSCPRLPIPVTVVGGEDCTVDIPFVRGARVVGRLVLCRPRADNGGLVPPPGTGARPPTAPSDFVEAGPVPNVILELASGSGVQHAISDTQGVFSFPACPPGPWTLRVQPDTLPEHHTLETGELRVNLSPGQTQTVLFRVLPRSRRVRIIHDGGTLREQP